MDAVNILLLWVVGFVSVMFLIIENLNSIEESRKACSEADHSRASNDSECKAAYDDQEEENKFDADGEADKKLVFEETTAAAKEEEIAEEEGEENRVNASSDESSKRDDTICRTVEHDNLLEESEKACRETNQSRATNDSESKTTNDDQEGGKTVDDDVDHDAEQLVFESYKSEVFAEITEEGEGEDAVEEEEENRVCESSDESDIGRGVLDVTGSKRGDIDMAYDNEDDWEGIERTELEKVFGEAVVFVSRKRNSDQISEDVKLQLYALQKVALEGVCHGSQPMAFKLSARAKWNAWQKLGEMSREVAMEKYVSILVKAIPGWKDSFHEEMSAQAPNTRTESDNIELIYKT